MRRWLLVTLLGACAHARPEPPIPAEHGVEELQAGELPAPARTEVAPAEPVPARMLPPASSARGAVDRAALAQVLDRSPAFLLQEVDPRARFRDGRFVGWELRRFFPTDPRFRAVDLQAGDVVLRVNGRSVERPEQLMEVWQALRTSAELVVETEREGTPRVFRWTIRD